VGVFINIHSLTFGKPVKFSTYFDGNFSETMGEKYEPMVRPNDKEIPRIFTSGTYRYRGDGRNLRDMIDPHIFLSTNGGEHVCDLRFRKLERKQTSLLIPVKTFIKGRKCNVAP
jgi:hypothetical protein